MNDKISAYGKVAVRMLWEVLPSRPRAGRFPESTFRAFQNAAYQAFRPAAAELAKRKMLSAAAKPQCLMPGWLRSHSGFFGPLTFDALRRRAAAMTGPGLLCFRFIPTCLHPSQFSSLSQRPPRLDISTHSSINVLLLSWHRIGFGGCRRANFGGCRRTNKRFRSGLRSGNARYNRPDKHQSEH